VTPCSVVAGYQRFRALSCLLHYTASQLRRLDLDCQDLNLGRGKDFFLFTATPGLVLRSIPPIRWISEALSTLE
jgi:hypothetical protein